MVKKNRLTSGVIGVLTALALLALFLAGPGLAWETTSPGAPGAGSAAPAAGQDHWVWQNPLPLGNSLNSVKFVDAQTGWAVGDFGTILKTTNGGATWLQQQSGTTYDLHGVTFLDTMSAWAVGQNGTVLKTTDGGANWISQRLVFPVEIGTLTSVAFADSQNGWIVGYVPDVAVTTIVRTSDGGITWTLGPRQLGFLFSIAFVDTQTGWAAGGGAAGIIVHTDDGGATWQDQSIDTGCTFTGVAFANAMTGWVVATCYKSPGRVFKTVDGGKSWSLQLSPACCPSAVSFISPATGWAAASGSVLRTVDGGATWEQHAASTEFLCSVSFVDAMNGWAVGRNGIIVHSSDGGATWAEQSSHIASDAAGHVSFVDVYTGWAVGNRIMKTTDGGITWVPQLAGTDRGLNFVTFADRSAVWAVGDSGTIVASTDGGATWVPQASGTVNSLYSIDFPDTRNGWAVGAFGTIIRSSDGGATWTPQASGTANDLDSVLFIDSQNGWVVGWFGTILHTSDGGATWLPQPSGATSGILTSVSFVNATAGWAVGSDGTILHTEDRGASWSPQSSGTSAFLESLDFIDSKAGWAVGRQGIILHTSDGGATWSSQQSGTAFDLESVDFVDAQTGWAAGSGIILRHLGDVPVPTPTPTSTPTPTPSPTPIPTPAIPNLSVTKLASKEKAFPGDPLTYLILLDNSGQEGITVSLTDTIPSSTSLISGTLSGGAAYSPTINSLLWSGTVPPGGSSLPSQFFSFRTTIDSEFSAGAVTNTVRVSDGTITTGASARTDVSRWTFLPLLARGVSGW